MTKASSDLRQSIVDIVGSLFYDALSVTGLYSVDMLISE
jgi:hypothetical protein